MAASFEFDIANGAGESVSHNQTTCNWKNADDTTTAYSAAPIAAGNNSYEQWVSGHFSGTYNNLSAGLWAHTGGSYSALNMVIKGQPAMTVDADRLAYATPSASANANLTFTQTDTIAITAGRAVWFGATSPTASGKAASSAANPAYTNYLTHQLQTNDSAAPGDTPTATFTLRYVEN